MNKRSQQQGFTLIELIVVIVILGILAVTAAPKFIDFTDKADKSAILGLKGAIEGAMTVPYADAAINGVAETSGSTTASGTTIDTHYGYPRATAASLLAAMSISANTDLSGDYEYAIGATDPATLVIAASSKFAADADHATTADIIATGCYVTYTEASKDGTDPIEIATAVVTCVAD
jgi:MSHA pilin protein MshA